MCVWAESIICAVKYEQISSVFPAWGLLSRMNENYLSGKAGMVKAMLFSLRVLKKQSVIKGCLKRRVNPPPHLLHCTYLHADVKTRIFTSVSMFLGLLSVGVNWCFDFLCSFYFAVCCIFPPPIYHSCTSTKHRKFCTFVEGSTYWFSILPLCKMFLLFQCSFTELKRVAFIYWLVVNIISFYTFFTAQSWKRNCALKIVIKFYMSSRAFKWLLFQRE